MNGTRRRFQYLTKPSPALKAASVKSFHINIDQVIYPVMWKWVAAKNNISKKKIALHKMENFFDML